MDSEENNNLSISAGPFEYSETTNDAPIQHTRQVRPANAIDLRGLSTTISNVDSLKYNTLKDRLLTYASFKSNVMTSLPLANAGFISLGNMDSVMCPFCQLQLHNFVEPIDAMALHQAYRDQLCPYLQELSGGGNDSQSSFPQPTTNMVEPMSCSDQLYGLTDGEEQSILADYLKFRTSSEQATMEKLSSQSSHDVADDMKREMRRQLSFTRSGLVETKASKQLASRGLFFKRRLLKKRVYSENAIACTFCDFSIPIVQGVSLKVADIISKHRYNEAKCLQVGNIPDMCNKYLWIDLEGQAVEGQTAMRCSINPVHSAMEVSERSATFLTYPYGGSKGKLELLAAGFFYEGNGDSVRCFSCGVVCSNWSPSEKAWERHARSSRNCQFVKDKKRDTFINGVIEQLGPYTLSKEENIIIKVTTRMLRPRWASIPVQRALAMGLNRDQVKTVIGNRIKKRENDFTCVADIMREVESLNCPCESANGAANGAARLPILPTAIVPERTQDGDCVLEDLGDDMVWFRWGSHSVQNSLMEVLGEERMRILAERHIEEGSRTTVNLTYILRLVAHVATEETDDSEDTDNRNPLIESPANVRAQLTCKICLSHAVGIIFLPCAHLVCCTDCAAAMTQCPICRKEIVGTIRINM